MKTYDLIIIGGGAAGIMSAISAKQTKPNLKVAILDRTFALGRKILVCGAGRCNITNINLNDQVETRYYSKRPDLVKRIFSKFGFKEIEQFFNNLGIELYVERKTFIGKLFPVTNQAQTVTDLLLDELNRFKVDIYLNTEVKSINHKENFTISTTNLETKDSLEFISSAIILSAGGKTYPALGSNGTGYDLAQNLGHNIIYPVPSALPLEAKNSLSHFASGVKVDAEVTSYIGGAQIKKTVDEVMLTNYGLSGPAILNISREISIRINRESKQDVEVSLNFFPGKSLEEVKNILSTRWDLRPDQELVKSLYGILPNKLAIGVMQSLNFPKGIKNSQLNKVQIDSLLNFLTQNKIKVSNTRGWNEAEFTAGGVDLYEVTDNLESKIIQKLFFCGEILDVDGDVGGFNLSWAWSSGNLVGQSAAKLL